MFHPYHWPPEVLIFLIAFLGPAPPLDVMQHDLVVVLQTAIEIIWSVVR